jgi:hypothetical protein
MLKHPPQELMQKSEKYFMKLVDEISSENEDA